MDRGERNSGIDALRGISIVLVVLHHVGLRLPLKRTLLAGCLPARVLSALNWNGYEAVFVFFVVSGFLITRRALERGPLARIDLRDFYRRRFARIAPCLIALLLVLAALHLAGVPEYVIAREGQSLPRALVAALTFHLNVYEARTGYLPAGWDVLWSLSIEEAFYLGFPLACRLLRPTWVLVVLLVALALSLPVTRAALEGNEIGQEKAYLPAMAAIATGIVAALATQRRVVHRVWPRLLVLVGGAGIAAVLFAEDALWKVLGQGTMLVLTFGTATLVSGLHVRSIARPARRSPRALGWLRAWGRLTYEIYLTHMFVVLAVVRLVQGRGLLAYALALPLTFALGWLVARYVSLPAEARLRARSRPGTA